MMIMNQNSMNESARHDKVLERLIEFTESCVIQNKGTQLEVRLFRRSEESPFARCFYLYILKALEKCHFEETSNQPKKEIDSPSITETLLNSLQEYRLKRIKYFETNETTQAKDSVNSLIFDKPYLQLLAFTLSILNFKNLDAQTYQSLKKLIQEVTTKDLSAYLTQIGVLKGKGSSGNLAMFQGVFIFAKIIMSENNDPDHQGSSHQDSGQLLNWLEFHSKNFNKNGFWGPTDTKSSYEQIQNGYHQYEIFNAARFYFQNDPRFTSALEEWTAPLFRAQQLTLAHQNLDSHFAPWPGGGGCHDYDATFILTLPLSLNPNSLNKPQEVEYSKHLEKTSEALQRLGHAILSEQCPEGGFAESTSVGWQYPQFWQHAFHSLSDMVFSNYHGKQSGKQSGKQRGNPTGKPGGKRSKPGNNPKNEYDAKFQVRATLGKLLPGKNIIPTHWTKTHRHWNEPNLWDTWFRLLTLAKVAQWNSTDARFSSFKSIHFLDFPGIGFEGNKQ